MPRSRIRFQFQVLPDHEVPARHRPRLPADQLPMDPGLRLARVQASAPELPPAHRLQQRRQQGHRAQRPGQEPPELVRRRQEQEVARPRRGHRQKLHR